MQHSFAEYFSEKALLCAYGSGGLAFAKMKKPVRDLCGLAPCLARSGALELRLATTRKEIRKAQRLRYKVFFEEGNAIPDRTAKLLRRDICAFDRACDHLLVIDHAARSKRLGIVKPKVIGVYRLLRQDVAERSGGFYSAQEFDLPALLARHKDKKFLELGRACVLADYRGKGVIELLWQGIGTYAQHHCIDVLLGCASLEGCNAAALGPQLAVLRQQSATTRASGLDWSAKAQDLRRIAMDRIDLTPLQSARALRALPPLVKAYLRCGAIVGDGAVADPRFGTTDVLMVLPLAEIAPRYLAQFGNAGLVNRVRASAEGRSAIPALIVSA